MRLPIPPIPHIVFQFSKINLAEVAGFEPANAGSKVLCLTAWRHPNKLVNRLFPIRQCLFHSHGAVSPTNVCVLFPHRQPHLSGGHRSFPVVRKEMKMTVPVRTGEPPTGQKEVMQTERKSHSRMGKDKTTRMDQLNDANPKHPIKHHQAGCPPCLRDHCNTATRFCQGVFENFSKLFAGISLNQPVKDNRRNQPLSPLASIL